MKFIKYWLPVIIYAIIIFYLSSIPGEEIPEAFRYQDAFLHIVEYALFAFLLSRAIKAYYAGFSFNKRLAAVWVLTFLYALSDEFHQSFVPQRYCSLLDLLYNGIGMVIGGILYR